MESTTLYELNEYLKRVVALNFQEPVWISCEISQVNEVRGQVYLEVIQQEEDTETVIAQSSAVIWYKSYLFLKSKLKELLPSILVSGTHVLIKVKVEYHERYGMKLVIEDIDPAYTIGHMEMTRKKILQQLADTNVIHLNQEKELPLVIARVAVISSATAAGYKDFVAQLAANEYGYQYDIVLHQAAMQGQNTEREICQALLNISETAGTYDCIVIIRGGGSKLDLSGFDNYNIGHRIATSPLPVITGIGHEIDQSVADVVAHTALKTPTAVAAYLLDHNLNFESEVHDMGAHIGMFAKSQLHSHQMTLERAWQVLALHPSSHIQNASSELEWVHNKLNELAHYRTKEAQEQLQFAGQIIKLSDPKTTLRRGYVMVESGGNVITKAAALVAGDEVVLTYYDGKKKAEISK